MDTSDFDDDEENDDDDEEDDHEDEDYISNFDDNEEDEEDCYEETCSEETYPGVRNVGFLGKVARTLSLFFFWKRNHFVMSCI